MKQVGKAFTFFYLTQMILTTLILLLCSGCQQDGTSPAPAASKSPPSLPPTEVPTPSITPGTISVPPGKPIAIDGTLSPGEWDSAAVETFSDGSELFLMYSDDYLYLGIRASMPGMIAGNILIYSGDKIAILHSSAALGTALYEKGTDSWEQTQDFVWRCRRTDSSQAAQAERDAFLEEEHWVAANSRMGSPNELEYQIGFTGETVRLAVNFLRASDPNVKIPWPVDLDDDSVQPVPGDLPAQLHLSPEKWATIDLPAEE